MSTRKKNEQDIVIVVNEATRKLLNNVDTEITELVKAHRAAVSKKEVLLSTIISQSEWEGSSDQEFRFNEDGNLVPVINENATNKSDN